MSRRNDLLREAAEAFSRAEDPFSTAWLVEHGVTADECFDLSQKISVAIDLFLLMALGEKP